MINYPGFLERTQSNGYTSTTGTPVDVNMNTVAYISPEQDGTTVYFVVPDQHGKLCSLTVNRS
jgi:hypothetical protein